MSRTMPVPTLVGRQDSKMDSVREALWLVYITDGEDSLVLFSMPLRLEPPRKPPAVVECSVEGS